MGATLEQNRLNTVSLLVLAAVAGGFALHWMRPVLVPFVLALMLAYLVAPWWTAYRFSCGHRAGLRC